jgi:hypothetical protein
MVEKPTQLRPALVGPRDANQNWAAACPSVPQAGEPELGRNVHIRTVTTRAIRTVNSVCFRTRTKAAIRTRARPRERRFVFGAAKNPATVAAGLLGYSSSSSSGGQSQGSPAKWRPPRSQIQVSARLNAFIRTPPHLQLQRRRKPLPTSARHARSAPIQASRPSELLPHAQSELPASTGSESRTRPRPELPARARSEPRFARGRTGRERPVLPASN